MTDFEKKGFDPTKKLSLKRGLEKKVLEKSACKIFFSLGEKIAFCEAIYLPAGFFLFTRSNAGTQNFATKKKYTKKAWMTVAKRGMRTRT